MPGMTLGISQSQRPSGSPRGSVVPTGRSVLRVWLPPEPSTMPSLCLLSVWDRPDVLQAEGRREEPSGQATSSVGLGESCCWVADPPCHEGGSCPPCLLARPPAVSKINTWA